MGKWAVAAVCLAIGGTVCAEEAAEFSLVCRAKLESLPTARKGDGYRPFWIFGDGAWELRLVWNSANGAPYRQIWARFNHVEADGTQRLFTVYQRDLDGLAADRWYHFVVTYSVRASEMRLYMDGFLIAMRKQDYDNKTNLLPLVKPAAFPEGPNVKDIEFLPRVLTEEEILKRGAAAMESRPSGKPFVWGTVDPTADDRFLPGMEVPAEVVSKALVVTVAKGEYEPGSVLVRCGRELKGLVPEIGELRCGKAVLPKDAVDVRVVKTVPTATIYPSVHGSRILKPMMLLHDDSLLRVDLATRRAELKLRTADGCRYVPCSDDPGDAYVQRMVKEHRWLNARYDAATWPIFDAKTIQPLDLPADVLKQYWVTVKAPDDATAGDYRATIVFRDARGTLLAKVPFTVRILPFRLPDAKAKYDVKRPYRRLLYTRHTRTDFDNATSGSITTNGRTLDQFRADLRNIRSHGIESPSIMMDLMLPRWNWNHWGQHDDLSSGRVETRTNRVDRAYAVRALKVLKEEGLVTRPLYINNGCNFGYREGYRAASKPTLTALVDETKAILREGIGSDEMCVYGVDEAKGNAIDRQYEAWNELRAQGVKVYATCLPKNVGKLAAGKVDTVVQSVKPTKENAALVHAYGGEILTYAFPQSGAKDDARAYRLCYGFGDWLNDYDGFSLYCWDEFSGNPWNEFENWGGKSYIYVFPTADGIVDTPSWEGQREAVDDVRYATLLRMMDDPEANAWLDALDPFAPGFDPSKCRAEIIDRILRIRKFSRQSL